MKFKKLLISLGLAAAVGLGVGAGLSVHTEAKAVKADGTWTVFYVYAPDEVSDYYDDTNHYDWLEKGWDAIEAHVYKDGGSSLSSWPGTMMNRLTPDVVGIGFNDTVGYDSLILSNCFADNPDVRTRSTWDECPDPIVFDTSSHNTFTISKFNCPKGTDSGSFNADYGWNVDVKTGSDSDAALTYNGAKQFSNTSVTLTAGTTFTIEDAFGTAITSGESGAGSAFDAGYIEYDSTNEVFVVNTTGTYEVYAKPSVANDAVSTFNGTVWMQIDSASEAAAWAEDFVTNVGCKVTYDEKPTNWDRYAADTGTYSWAANLTNGAKYLFVTATASSTGNWVEKAAFIHDMCVAKYEGCDVFMKYNDGEDHSRLTPKVVDGPLGIISTNNSATMITIVSIIALTSITAVAIVLVIKKRKHN